MQNIDCGETNVTWTSKNYFKPRHYKNCYLSCKLQFYYEQFIALNFPIIWHNDDRTNSEVKMKSFAFSNFLIKSGATDSIDVSRTSIKSLMFIRHCYLVQTIVAPFWGNCWKHLSCFLFHHLVTLLVTAEVGNMLALLRELDVV